MIDIYLRNLKDVILHPFISLLTNNFKALSPNHITLASGATGLIGIYFSFLNYRTTSCIIFLIGRVLDGLDGAFARATNQTSDFGAYLDIIVDFTIYGLTPLAVTAGQYYFQIEIGDAEILTKDIMLPWILLVLLEITFFVNSAGLFFLSALIEKNQNARQEYKKNDLRTKEVTTLKMPAALVEGTESITMFGLIILLPSFQCELYILFGLGVTISILQRLRWAYKHLS